MSHFHTSCNFLTAPIDYTFHRLFVIQYNLFIKPKCQVMMTHSYIEVELQFMILSGLSTSYMQRHESFKKKCSSFTLISIPLLILQSFNFITSRSLQFSCQFFTSYVITITHIFLELHIFC